MPNIKIGITTAFPTELDIAETKGKGKIGDENNMQDTAFHGRPYNHVIPDRDSGVQKETAGFVITAGTFPAVTITAGECWINGTWFQFSADLVDDDGDPFEVSSTPSQDNYFFIRIDRDGSNRIQKAIMEVVSVGFDVNPTLPNEAVPIALVRTDAVPAITEIRDMRPSAFSQNVFIELTKEKTGAIEFTFIPQPIYVPWFGEFSCISAIFNTGTKVGTGSTSVNGQLRVTGPLGSKLGAIVTTPSSGAPGDAKDAILLSVCFENKLIGRFNEVDLTTNSFNRGGYVNLDLGVGTGGSPTGIVQSNLIGGSLLLSRDFRSTGRITNWGSVF